MSGMYLNWNNLRYELFKITSSDSDKWKNSLIGKDFKNVKLELYIPRNRCFLFEYPYWQINRFSASFSTKELVVNYM